MRIAFYLTIFLGIITLTACQKNNYSNQNKQENILSVERIESSRKMHYDLIVDKYTVVLIKNENDTIRIKNTTKEWENLTKLMNQILLEKLENIKSPSQAFMHDGAPNVVLKFQTKDSTYYSNPYDKGNPAKELNKIDDYLTELSTSLSK